MKKIKMIFAACFIMGVLFYCPRFSVKAMAYETAWFPAPQMNLSQIAYETGRVHRMEIIMQLIFYREEGYLHHLPEW